MSVYKDDTYFSVFDNQHESIILHLLFYVEYKHPSYILEK